jgi:hypothetical protein
VRGSPLRCSFTPASVVQIDTARVAARFCHSHSTRNTTGRFYRNTLKCPLWVISRHLRCNRPTATAKAAIDHTEQDRSDGSRDRRHNQTQWQSGRDAGPALYSGAKEALRLADSCTLLVKPTDNAPARQCAGDRAHCSGDNARHARSRGLMPRGRAASRAWFQSNPFCEYYLSGGGR